MVRWPPGTRERLQVAALELYLSRGFEPTTVTEIAGAVGVTERTFYRHFADKREVLFDGQETLTASMLAGAAAAGPTASSHRLVVAALASLADFFPDERRDYARRRQRVIVANPGLQERELLKLAGLAAALAAALRARGVEEPEATVAAQTCLTVFGISFARWIGAGEQRSLAVLQHEALDALQRVAEG